jgi:hypothetical protein
MEPLLPIDVAGTTASIDDGPSGSGQRWVKASITA